MPSGLKVTFYQGTQDEYDAVSSKDSNGIYFLSDSRSIYKGDTKYGGGDIDIATSSSVGTVKPGTDFDIAADGTLSLYKAVNVTSFTNNIGNKEKGSSVDSVTLQWAVNKTPASQTLTQGSNTYAVTASDRSKTISFSTPLTANTTFTLTAKDARNASSSKTTSINFLNGRYWGIGTVTTADGITNAFVQGLTKELASGRTKTFSVIAGAGQYIYYAIPASFGTPSFYVGGFEGGFDLIKTFSFTNASGYAESYTVYKSTNANLGATTVEVK